MNSYTERVLSRIEAQYAHEKEYLQSVRAWVEMIEPALDDPRFE